MNPLGGEVYAAGGYTLTYKEEGIAKETTTFKEGVADETGWAETEKVTVKLDGTKVEVLCGLEHGHVVEMMTTVAEAP